MRTSSGPVQVMWMRLVFVWDFPHGKIGYHPSHKTAACLPSHTPNRWIFPGTVCSELRGHNIPYFYLDKVCWGCQGLGHNYGKMSEMCSESLTTSRKVPAINSWQTSFCCHWEKWSDNNVNTLSAPARFRLHVKWSFCCRSDQCDDLNIMSTNCVNSSAGIFIYLWPRETYLKMWSD